MSPRPSTEGAQPRRGVSFRIAASFAGLFLGAALCEGLLRVLGVFPSAWPAPYRHLYPEFQAAQDYSSHYGRYKPGSEIPVFVEGRVILGRIDELGYLGTPGRQPVEGDLLVFGDSFAYGFGVPAERAFAALMDGYNAGFWGQSFPFHAGVFNRVVPVIRPTRALWIIYPPHVITCGHGWVTRRNVDPATHPVLAFLLACYNETRLSTLVLKATGWGANRSDYYTLEWSLYDPKDTLPDSGYARFESAATEIVQSARRQHVQLIPVLVPSKNRIGLELEHLRPPPYVGGPLVPGLAEERMASILERHGVPRSQQVNLMDLMRGAPQAWRGYYFKGDAHFSEAGNAAVAAYLKDRLARLPAPGS